MYLCVCVCVCVCTHMHLYIYIYINICIQVSSTGSSPPCAGLDCHTYTNVFVFIQDTIHINISTRLYIYVDLSIYTKVCVYTYAHIYAPAWGWAAMSTLCASGCTRSVLRDQSNGRPGNGCTRAGGASHHTSPRGCLHSLPKKIKYN